jgi:hypothetical protein
MIVIRKKLKGIIPYRIIYWPTEEALQDLAQNLPSTHYARVEAATPDIERRRCIVAHHLSLTLLIDLRRTLDQIYKDLISNARIRIHKAEKLGSRITLRRYRGGPDNEKLVDEFVEIYNQVVRGKPTVASPISAALVRSYFPNADLLIGYLDGRAICGHLNLVDSEVGVSRLLHSGNQRFQDQATARLAGILNVYLHWYEIEKYREEGLISYDFGSIGQVEDSLGVNRFKMQFGGTIVREHNYILAGMPLAWRMAFKVMTQLMGRWQRRVQIEKAGDQWRDMSTARIREIIESSIETYQRNLRAGGAPGKYPADLSRPSDVSL